MKNHKILIIFIVYLVCQINGRSYNGLRAWFSSSALSFGGGGSLLNLSESDRKNPALLSNFNGSKLNLDFVRYPADIQANHFGYTKRIRGKTFCSRFFGGHIGVFDRGVKKSIHCSSTTHRIYRT